MTRGWTCRLQVVQGLGGGGQLGTWCWHACEGLLFFVSWPRGREEGRQRALLFFPPLPCVRKLNEGCLLFLAVCAARRRPWAHGRWFPPASLLSFWRSLEWCPRWKSLWRGGGIANVVTGDRSISACLPRPLCLLVLVLVCFTHRFSIYAAGRREARDTFVDFSCFRLPTRRNDVGVFSS